MNFSREAVERIRATADELQREVEELRQDSVEGAEV